MELALGTDGRDALRLRGAAVGGPVLGPDSGAVTAVVGTALRGGHTAAGFAVPLVGVSTVEPLSALLRRNATTVPGYGRDLNLLALHAAGPVRAYVDSHPEGGAHVAEYIDRRMEHGPAARAMLLPLVSGLLRDRPAPAPVRGALAGVLAAPGTPAFRGAARRAAGGAAGVRAGCPP